MCGKMEIVVYVDIFGVIWEIVLEIIGVVLKIVIIVVVGLVMGDVIFLINVLWVISLCKMIEDFGLE